MAIRLFQRNRKNDSVKQHLQSFNETFSDEEKKAVLCCLFIIANSDGEYHEKETEFFVKTAEMLDYDIKYSVAEVAKEFISLVDNQLFRVLQKLNDEQKDWFIITLHGMIQADGRTEESEIRQINLILRRVGITRDHYDDVVQRSKLLAALS